MSDDVAAGRAAGHQQCMFGTAENHCGAPARMHVMQTDEYPTMSCRRHESYWITTPCLDAHLIGPTCGLPGTTWLYSWHPDGDRCIVEGLEAT